MEGAYGAGAGNHRENHGARVGRIGDEGDVFEPSVISNLEMMQWKMGWVLVKRRNLPRESSLRLSIHLLIDTLRDKSWVRRSAYGRQACC